MAAPKQTKTTFGHDINLWEQAKEEALRELTAIAKAKTLISYGDLTRKIRSIAFMPDGRDFHTLLGQLSEESDAAGQGMISVLVVHQDGDQKPGNGFFILAKELGRDTSDKDRCWIKELNRVYSNLG